MLPMTNLNRRFSVLASSLALSLLAACGTTAAPVATPTPTPSRPGPAMVQIENSILARPQAGLQQADLVYEYLAEGGITRMTVIYFRPSGNQRIEPVRSARPVTIRLWHAYHGVIFFSGANQKVLDMIAAEHIPALSESSDGGIYFARDPARRAPHNLYTDGDRLAQGLKKFAPRVTYLLPTAGTPPASRCPPRPASPGPTWWTGPRRSPCPDVDSAQQALEGRLPQGAGRLISPAGTRPTKSVGYRHGDHDAIRARSPG